jgi:L-ascorbate metabolism protein UlaG (beta-lactamase superfamily)
VTDPYNGDIGYQLPKKLKAEIVTVSHEASGHANVSVWPASTHVLKGPGEYEIGEVFVIGIDTHNPEDINRTNVVYLMDFDGLNVVHLGDLSYVPGQSEIDKLGAVNVALVPVGGGRGLNAAQAAEIVSLIEPEIVVPMHYQTEYSKIPLDPLDKFLKVMGIGNVTPESVLRITAGSLPEQTQVVVLEPQQ